MTSGAIALCILCQLLLVFGQLALKRGMTAANRSPKPWGLVLRDVGLGIALQTGWFFLWLGLLEKWELSRIFPFEGLNPALLVVGSWLLLGEKLTASAWLGIAMICGGVLLVSGS